MAILDPRYHSVQQYAEEMRIDGEWVDEPFIYAFALQYGVTISVWSTARGGWIVLKGGDKEKIFLGCRNNVHFYGSRPLFSPFNIIQPPFADSNSSKVSNSTSLHEGN